MTPRQRALAVAAGVTLCAFICFGPRPLLTKSETKSETKSRQVEALAVAVDHSTVETTHADGSRSVERRDVVTREAKHEVAHEVVRVVTVEKRTALPRWRVTALAGVASRPPLVPLSGAPVIVGASVDRRIIGNVWVGVWADNSVAAGVRVGVEW